MLPKIVDVKTGRKDGNRYSLVQFENGARYRLLLTDGNRVLEQTFLPNDTDVYHESDVTGHHEDGEVPNVHEYMTVALEVYFDHEDVSDLEAGWEPLWDTLTHKQRF